MPIDREFELHCAACVPLGPWLELAERAGVPLIDAAFSDPFPAEEIQASADGEPAPAFAAAVAWANDRLTWAGRAGNRLMVRFECSSGSDLKHAAARGAPYGPAYYAITGDDPRLETPPFGCTIPDAAGNTRLCVRPWVDALRVDGYPLEFRAFHDADGFQGVSSYYPQRPLPSEDVYLIAATQAAEYARRLAAAGSFPVGFTADFLVTPAGEVLLLEGGPPHHMGLCSAHPCCFAPGEIRGIALARREGAPTE